MQHHSQETLAPDEPGVVSSSHGQPGHRILPSLLCISKPTLSFQNQAFFPPYPFQNTGPEHITTDPGSTNLKNKAGMLILHSKSPEVR